ncbi:hypothetical protein M2T92_05005 [Elizabethkingia miricola]|uniref:hypothetical protein n=1 Tax=Elizabethkingia miricola TaxID=172045 RepID=UPI002013223B|nr:hypothetical protein [Elizabethkingia miricola]MCL1678372.1 hypothetical protein [Elizabethkingia miricola]
MNPILIEFYFYKTLPIFPIYKWDYDKFQKVYRNESFDTDFENEVFNFFKRPLSNFYSETKTGAFFIPNAMELNENEVAFHAEFDNILFFYLYKSIRSYLEKFYETLETNFSEYIDNENYRIPVYFYNERYTYFREIPSVYEVFKFIIETRTNIIEKHDNNILININLLKSFEEKFREYSFA